MKLGRGQHLGYCTNIHPGETWAQVRASLQAHVPLIRARVCPGQAFGIGLRLSAQAAQTLTDPAQLAEFRQFLRAHELYVFTLNGFPYGTFHGAPVKEAVYRPDWRTPERLRYSNTLADLLAQLLPREAGLQGSVSTVPGAFKADIATPADIEAMRRNLVSHAGHLVALERDSGRHITLALEPEPCCFLETIADAVDFFGQELFGAASGAELAAHARISPAAAAAALREHLGLCLDLCHAAVEFEDVDDCLLRLDAVGIRILKMQISAGLCVAPVDTAAVQALRGYAESVYLHQVVERTPDGLRRFTDLPQALGSLEPPREPLEWRVHFHVPVFRKALGGLRSSRDFIETALARHRDRPLCEHLEVETYTWDVLPESLCPGPVDEAIARELDWVLHQLAP